MKNKILNNTLRKNYFFWVFATISALLLIVSFILPPTGVIDPSALAGSGELFAWAALGTLIKSLDKGVDAKVRHGSTEVELNNPDNN